MKTKLIAALRTAATAMEVGTFRYKWSSPSCCNCGSLFCALTGKSAVELQAEIPGAIGENTSATWGTLIAQHCPMTGLPTQKLFRELLGYGLTQVDMMNLEYLRDSKVIARMNLNESVREEIPAQRKWYQLRTPRPTVLVKNVRVKLNHKNKEHVIAYMRTWADLLTEEGAMDVAAPKMQHAQVS
jgi:hypothetical protein